MAQGTADPFNINAAARNVFANLFPPPQDEWQAKKLAADYLKSQAETANEKQKLADTLSGNALHKQLGPLLEQAITVDPNGQPIVRPDQLAKVIGTLMSNPAGNKIMPELSGNILRATPYSETQWTANERGKLPQRLRSSIAGKDVLMNTPGGTIRVDQALGDALPQDPVSGDLSLIHPQGAGATPARGPSGAPVQSSAIAGTADAQAPAFNPATQKVPMIVPGTEKKKPVNAAAERELRVNLGLLANTRAAQDKVAAAGDNAFGWAPGIASLFGQPGISLLNSYQGNEPNSVARIAAAKVGALDTRAISGQSLTSNEQKRNAQFAISPWGSRADTLTKLKENTDALERQISEYPKEQLASLLDEFKAAGVTNYGPLAKSLAERGIQIHQQPVQPTQSGGQLSYGDLNRRLAEADLILRDPEASKEERAAAMKFKQTATGGH